MKSYIEQIKDLQTFSSDNELYTHFNAHRRAHRFEYSEKENNVLYTMAKSARQVPGVCKLLIATIAKKAEVSESTVKRAIGKAVKFGLLVRKATRKKNGQQGATAYVFQPIKNLVEPQEEPLHLNRGQEEKNASNPYDSKVSASQPFSYMSFFFNSFLKSLNNTFITAQSVTPSVGTSIKKEERKQQEQQALREALLAKMPAPLCVLDLFVTDNNELFECNGAIFNAKKAVDASVRIEEHADAYKQMITSVVEYYKRKVAVDGPAAHNLAGLLYVSTKALTKRIANGEYYAPKAEQQPVKEDVAVNGVTQAMIDNETDPFEKDRLLKQRKGTRASGRVEKTPDWFATRHEQAEEELTAAQEAELEAARQRILAKLYV